MDSDVTGAAAGVCKLQRVYHISATSMAAMKSPFIPAASAEDLKDVARGCFSTGPFGSTAAWSRAAIERTSVIGGSSLNLQHGLRRLKDNDERRSKMSRPSIRYPPPPQSDVHSYKSVCTAEGDLRPPGGHLFCTMSTNFGDPRLILAPHKIELLSMEPRIVFFPGFLSPSEVSYIRAAARGKFERVEIYDAKTRGDTKTWKRIGKVSWLNDCEHPKLQRLTRRIAAVTNLSLESAESYQVVNYGLGGHYTPHMDAHRFDKVSSDFDEKNGNRLATMLMYLADVAAGGATAFVQLGIGLKPRVGDALFWYDVEPYDGSKAPETFSFWHQKRKVDERTQHVGCPVLWGSKWIVTKWIRERNNVVTRYNTPG
ncbi:prolyl 4-hydroxylase subunit alpha-1-like [Amblyomma americanum]